MNKAFPSLSRAISVMLTAFIIYGVYTETGPYTAVACVFMWAVTELICRFMVASNKAMQRLSDIVIKINERG